MPKTIKKTKNSASGFKRFLGKLNPNTPKKKLLTFVLVFALIGGGYMTYKSFAATGAGVYGADQIVSSFGSTTRIVEGNGHKKGTTVWRLNSNGSSVEIGPRPVIWAPYIKVCANVYTTESNARLELIVTNGSHKATHGSSGAPVSSSGYYQKMCSPELHHLSQYANQPIRGIAVSRSPGGADIKVGSMSLEYTSGGGK